MNEALTVFLNIDERKVKENDALIQRIDELLLDCGMVYSGIANVYKPLEEKNRDHAVFTACLALNEADWLQDKLAHIPIVNRASACPMEKIQLTNMKEPAASKLEYYEKYYREYHTLAHGIVVDEHGNLRDGYVSYIIARKYGIRPEVYEAFAQQPLKKIVKGRHVFKDKDGWRIKSNKGYIWNYSLKNPVVPGDILRVKTKRGWAYMCVYGIGYVTGKEFCEEHRNVIRHMKERIRFGE